MWSRARARARPDRGTPTSPLPPNPESFHYSCDAQGTPLPAFTCDWLAPASVTQSCPPTPFGLSVAVTEAPPPGPCPAAEPCDWLRELACFPAPAPSGASGGSVGPRGSCQSNSSLHPPRALPRAARARTHAPRAPLPARAPVARTSRPLKL